MYPVNCTPEHCLRAYLEIRELIRSYHDEGRGCSDYGIGSFLFRDRADANRAEAIIKRCLR